ncbi:MAG TPA: hypothetical protein DDW88_00150 [Treponema sp.]|jgi:hypothetical protein|nr:hypothetical protein [Treponema sp.]
MTSFDINTAAETITTINKKNKKEAEKRRLDAQKEGMLVAKKLKATIPEIQAIWGFGSTFEKNKPYHLHSDIDLAIEGGDILQAILLAEKSHFKIDIIEITDTDDNFVRLLKQNGIRLA